MTIDTLIKRLQVAAKDNPYREVRIMQYDEIYSRSDGTCAVDNIEDHNDSEVVIG